MVCFQVKLIHALSKRRLRNLMVDQKLEHLFHHRSASLLEIKYIPHKKQSIYTVLVCDEDAVALLRDMPPKILCLSIRLQKTNTLLYSNYKLTREWSRPPRDPLMKDVYWMASKLEPRNQSPENQTY